jgi:hypothetical protein
MAAARLRHVLILCCLPKKDREDSLVGCVCLSERGGEGGGVG